MVRRALVSLPQHALLAAIVDSSSDAIVSKTLDGTVTSWNASAERIFGYSAAEMIGESIIRLLPPECLAEEAWILQHLRNGERIENFETIRIRKDGRRIDVAVTSSPVRDAAGEIVGASKIVRDVTAARLAARELEDRQARFRGIFDNAFQFFGLLSPVGRILEVNPAALDMGGLQAPDVVGLPLWDASWFVDSATNRTRVRDGVERAAAGEFARFELDLSSRGEPVTLDFSLRPVRDAAGRVVLIVPEGRDISERKRDEQARQESEARLAAVVDSAMDAIVTVDDRGVILLFNDAAADVFGCDRDQAIGTPLERFLPGHFNAADRAWTTASRARRAGGGPANRPAVLRAFRADGRAFPAEASVSTVRVHGSRIHTVILRDVSELRQAQEARRVLETQLREAQKMEAVGTLAGGIAHDFNNVMGAIVGNVALAKDDLEPGHAARTSLDQIERAANRARAVVRQILAFSRRQPQELVDQPLGPIVSEAIGLLRATLPTIVRIEASAPARPVPVRIDANQILQVLLNLCTNAWHALKGSTGRIRVGFDVGEFDAAQAIQVGDLAPGPHVHLWVADDGCGMTPETAARIFEPFFTTKPRGEGTGLGLAVVHGIVAAHDGAIAVESLPGAGTTFHVYLPLAPSLAEAPPAAATGKGAVEGDEAGDGTGTDTPAGIGIGKGEAGRQGRGQRVAYVDDDDVMLLMVERLLRRQGFEPLCFQQPRQLVEQLRARPDSVDIVVSDYNMPDLSGLDVAQAVSVCAPGVPVIVSSGYVSEELRRDAAGAGVRGLLEKQNTLEDLCPLVLRVLRGEDALA